jgi:hypothetical protein
LGSAWSIRASTQLPSSRSEQAQLTGRARPFACEPRGGQPGFELAAGNDLVVRVDPRGDVPEQRRPLFSRCLAKNVERSTGRGASSVELADRGLVEGRLELFAGGGIQAVERAAKLGAAIAGDKR